MSDSRKIFIGADHAGVAFKKMVVDTLRKEFPDRNVEDLGPLTEESVHYPDYAKRVAEQVSHGKGVGILICGSGIGMSISANKLPNVRAALVWDTTSARLSREHNDANVLCLGARLVGPEVGLDAVRTWLKTPFAGGRHQLRIDLIKTLEEKK